MPVIADLDHPLDRLDCVRGTWIASAPDEPGFLVRLWRNGFELERRLSEDTTGTTWLWAGTRPDAVERNLPTNGRVHYVEIEQQDGWIRFEETEMPEPGLYFEYRRTSDSTMVFTSDEGRYTLTRIDD